MKPGVVWLALVCLTAGCGERPVEGVRMALATMPTSLDPRIAADAASTRINRLLYESLTEFDDGSRPTPALAGWEQLAPDHYRFHLSTVRGSFPDGRQPDANDVAATYKSILDPATASPHRGTLAHIARIEVLSAETVDFHLSRDDYLFPGYLAIGILPVERLRAGHDFNREPWGSGEFRFVQRPSDAQIELRRRSDGAKFVFVHVADPTVRALKLLHGEIDLLQNDMPAELTAYLEKQPALTAVKAPGITFAYIGFNLDDPVSGNLLLRRAVAHAIDRSSIVRYLFADNARLAQSILPPEHWAGVKDQQGYAFAPDRAKALVRELGFDVSRPLRIEYKTSSDAFRLRVAAALQAQLAAVGIDMSIRSYDWGTFFGDIKGGRFQMYSLAWVGVESPDVFRYVFHSASLPPKGANRGRYRSAGVDALIDAAESGSTETARVTAFQAIQKRVHQDLVYVPLWYEGHVAVLGERISGYRLGRRGDYDALRDVRILTGP